MSIPTISFGETVLSKSTCVLYSFPWSPVSPLTGTVDGRSRSHGSVSEPECHLWQLLERGPVLVWVTCLQSLSSDEHDPNQGWTRQPTRVCAGGVGSGQTFVFESGRRTSRPRPRTETRDTCLRVTNSRT